MNRKQRDLLVRAYEIVSGIPKENLDLRVFLTERGETMCNTIACAGGWLAMHPEFNKLGLKFLDPVNGRQIVYKGKSNMEAMMKLFGLDLDTTWDLFGPRTYKEERNEFHLHDSQLWMSRIEKFLTGKKHDR